mmetsp:Transcript_36473/g.95506  ORF Transcript_36473/g.95506 Transcript_36473/m.95506 type:complete len:210 (-) Transcript_36473:305-934(-)
MAQYRHILLRTKNGVRDVDPQAHCSRVVDFQDRVGCAVKQFSKFRVPMVYIQGMMTVLSQCLDCAGKEGLIEGHLEGQCSDDLINRAEEHRPSNVLLVNVVDNRTQAKPINPKCHVILRPRHKRLVQSGDVNVVKVCISCARFSVYSITQRRLYLSDITGFKIALCYCVGKALRSTIISIYEKWCSVGRRALRNHHICVTAQSHDLVWT